MVIGGLILLALIMGTVLAVAIPITLKDKTPGELTHPSVPNIGYVAEYPANNTGILVVYCSVYINKYNNQIFSHDTGFRRNLNFSFFN
jgi:hypothetical protein